MRPHTLLHVLLSLCLLAGRAGGVEIVVHVPSDTPKDAVLYLAGSLPMAGNWKADGLKLDRRDDATFAAVVSLAPGQRLEYKITRGSWDTVEKNEDGSECRNRLLTGDATAKPVEITVQKWSSGVGDIHSTVKGNLQVRNLDSKYLGKRNIRVWLPDGYDDHSERRFAVLYMQDGQNLFDRKTSAFGSEWQVDETLTRLIAEGKIPPLIVVGIDNGGAERINEYTFDAHAKMGGGAERYEQFLLEEVIPFVKREYRTDASTTIVGGSSLGGIVSLELVLRHPQTFGGAMVMSPSLWWADQATLRHLEQNADELKPCSIYLDIGTREGGDAGKHVELAERAAKILSDHDVTHQLLIKNGAEHNEQAWAARFGDAVQFLFTTKNLKR